MAEILDLYDSPYFGMNMDTGNAFIAGRDPVAFLDQFKHKVNHVHVKDVSAELAAALRGEATGIALSACAIGEGVNADNIRKCIGILAKSGFQGTLCLECDAQGGPVLERSLAWVRQVLAEVQ
jgi:sugar phosphate isomerase/epimerase